MSADEDAALYDALGKKLAKLREKNNCSQQRLCNVLNIHQSTYAGYETGIRKIPLSVLKKLSDYFQVSVDYLLGVSVDSKNTLSVAAHHDGDEDWSQEELKYLELAKRMILEQRQRKM